MKKTASAIDQEVKETAAIDNLNEDSCYCIYLNYIYKININIYI